MRIRTPLPRTTTRPTLVGATILLLAATACGGDDGSASGDRDEPVPPGTVLVDDNSFEPATLGVQVGDTVTWEWVGDQPHNVVHDDFRSEVQSDGVFEHTFDEAGTYGYVCTLHRGMEGTVDVSA